MPTPQLTNQRTFKDSFNTAFSQPELNFSQLALANDAVDNINIYSPDSPTDDMVHLNQEREGIQQSIDSGEITPSVGKIELLANNYWRNRLKSKGLDTIGNGDPEYRKEYDRQKMDEISQQIAIQCQAIDNFLKPIRQNEFLRDYSEGRFNGPLTQEQQQLVDDATIQSLNQEYGVNYSSEDWAKIKAYLENLGKTAYYAPQIQGGFAYASPQYQTGMQNNARMQSSEYQALAKQYPDVIPKLVAQYNKGEMDNTNRFVGQVANMGTYFIPYVGEARMLYDGGKELWNGDYLNAGIDFAFGAAKPLKLLGNYLRTPSIIGSENAARNLFNMTRSSNFSGKFSPATKFTTPLGTFQNAYGFTAFNPSTFGKVIGTGMQYAPEAATAAMVGKGGYGLIKDNLLDNTLTPEERKDNNWQNGLYFGLGLTGMMPVLSTRIKNPFTSWGKNTIYRHSTR